MATGTSQKKGTSARGFASMSPEQQRAIARKGGEAVSQNRAHMAAIGRKGGEATHARHTRTDKVGEQHTEAQQQSATAETNDNSELNIYHVDTTTDDKKENPEQET